MNCVTQREFLDLRIGKTEMIWKMGKRDFPILFVKNIRIY